MSGFSIGIAILGGLVLAAVVAWNTWTTRRAAPRLPDPVLEPAAGAAGAADVAMGERTEPVLDDLAPQRSAGDRRMRLDALIDAIAHVALDSPVSGDAALPLLPPTRRAGGKPFAIEGLNERTQQWEPPQPGERYSAFQAGVQLANRSGALNEIEFSEFVVKTQAFADAVGGNADFPDMRPEVARARELDQFAGGHDAQLSFTLRARQAPWSPGFIQQHAGRAGFVPGAVPGRLVLPSAQAGGAPVLALSFDPQAALADDPALSAVHAVTLTLDVPQVDRAEQPFVRMRTVAQALAQAMDGVLTGDDGQIIRPEALDVIGADLERLYDVLDGHDLSAGSPQARRLFS